MTAKRVGVALLGVALAAGTLSAAAQEPAGPPPPSSRVEDQGTAVLELLPALGRIGAQAGLLVGFSRNPYGVGSGVQADGYLDVPVGRVAGGQLSYEVLADVRLARHAPLVITDLRAYLANLAARPSPLPSPAGPSA